MFAHFFEKHFFTAEFRKDSNPLAIKTYKRGIRPLASSEVSFYSFECTYRYFAPKTFFSGDNFFLKQEVKQSFRGLNLKPGANPTNCEFTTTTPAL
jgi:hypothetical protein